MSGMIYDRTLLAIHFYQSMKNFMESQVRYWAFSFIRVVQAFTRMNIIGQRDLFALQIFYKYTFYGTYILYFSYFRGSFLLRVQLYLKK